MGMQGTDELYCRLRNRIIEHLELVTSAEEQLAYQNAAPIAHVADELFNAWGDWVADEDAIREFSLPVISAEEQLAVREFNQVLESVAARTARELPDITEFIGTAPWQELSSAAARALAVFRVRGLSPEAGAI